MRSLNKRPLDAGEAFGWGCIRGLHTDRGKPNLTLRMGMEAHIGRRLLQTWELRHRARDHKAVSAMWVGKGTDKLRRPSDPCHHPPASTLPHARRRTRQVD
eukprot:gene8740-7565_t